MGGKLYHSFKKNCLYRYPDDVYEASLTKDYVEIIYEAYSLMNVHTKEQISNSIELSFSYGVFSKFNNELLAWVMQTHFGAVGMLYILEKARRRGFAKTLVMRMAKKMSEEGIPPYAMIMESNEKSFSLSHSIGPEEIICIKYLKVNQN